MTRHYSMESALLPGGWARAVTVGIDDDGTIRTVEVAGSGNGPNGARGAELISGIVVPGMANSHSHAFQRAMTGNTEYRLSARDSFWTWRHAMYRLANQIEPADLQTIATQLFIEMLKAGYTSVAEFHYLHRQRSGVPYPGRNELWDAVTEAANAAGIALTFLPTLYQSSDFGAQPLKPEQARFAFETDEFLTAIEHRLADERRAPSTTLRTGAAFHSLRAVPFPVLHEVAAALTLMNPALPLHIHVAEQVKEVAACRAHVARRPIEWLLESGLLNDHWCLVHATHATPAELQGISTSGASVCVSITTEANLGDGFFDAARFLQAGGRLCVGSDSQITVCPAEELRWMEYQQRLRKRRRNVLAGSAGEHAGTRLWQHAAEAGAQAIGQPAGAIAVGRRADWLVLDRYHPSMAGATLEATLDHVLFAGGSAAIKDVMVAGRWVVKSRQHPAEEQQRSRFGALMSRIAS